MKLTYFKYLPLALLAGCGVATDPTPGAAAAAPPVAAVSQPAAADSATSSERHSEPAVALPLAKLEPPRPSPSPDGARTGEPPHLSVPSLQLDPGTVQADNVIIPIHLPDPAKCLDDATGKIVTKSISLLNTAPGRLGGATGNVETIASCIGYRRRFAGGSIFYKSGASDAYAVFGDIAALYGAYGEQGGLGYPLTDENGTPDGIGRYNHFDWSSIYWKPNLGPHAIWGVLRDRWAAEGWERNVNLGYPITSIVGLPGGDQMVSFENGVLFEKAGATVACELAAAPESFGSKTSDEMKDQITQMIRDQLGGDVELQSVNYFQMTDYIRDGWGAQNRRYVISVHNKYDNGIPLVPDPNGDLELQIEIRLNRDTSNVEFVIRNWSSHVSGVGNGTVNQRIADKLNPQTNVAQVLQSVPPIINEVKPMANGDLRVYVSPWSCS